MKPTSLILAVALALTVASGAKGQQHLFHSPRSTGETLDKKLTLAQSRLNTTQFLYSSFMREEASATWKWETILCYDEQDLAIQRLSQSFDENGKAQVQLIEEMQAGNWVNYLRSSYTYNGQGSIQEAITEGWLGNAWMNMLRLTITYNPAGRITMESVEKSVGEAWVNSFRRSYTYDAAGNKTGMLQQNFLDGGWVDKLKATFTYDNEGNLMSAISEFSESGGPWQPGARFTYTNDENGYWTEQLIESGETGAWEVVARCIYTNDADGNILSEVYQYWDMGNWVNDARKTYAYDTHGNVTSGENERWQDGSWLRDMQSSYLLFKKEIIFVLNADLYRYSASYLPFSMGVEEGDQAGLFLLLYPNPAKDEIFVEFDNGHVDGVTLNIFNAAGALVKTVTHKSNNAEIDVSELEGGVYVVKMLAGSYVHTRKIIISE